MSEHRQVLDHFHKRLLAAVTRSALLKATVTRSGRLLDCSRFGFVEEGIDGRILRAVVECEAAVPVELRLRFSHADADYVDDSAERKESPDDKIVREHRAIYDALDRRMRRVAELVKRETGVQSLWLGYPLLYVQVGEDDDQRWILAPLFLWPISIQLDHGHEGRVFIGRDHQAGPVKFNRAMAGWVKRQLNLQLLGPDEDELERFSWSNLKSHVQSLAKQFHDPPSVECDHPLEPLPNAKLLNPQHSPRLFNSAVLGIYRWQNEAILADLQSLKDLEKIDGVASGFTSGTPLPRPPEVQRPLESDRYQVYDADFSQERVIWQARTEPGLVMHGPPGTGKSQTIVNIVADALAHRRTVLMVCQKYAATRVVYEKLKQVGLDSLCLEVTDSEGGRLPVFRAIRDQVGSLPALVTEGSTIRRNQLADEITRLENELDHYARAVHERDGEVGLNYRQMKAVEGQTYSQFPTVRPLSSLYSVAVRMSAQQLDSLNREITEAGCLFGLGRPWTNPWRFRQPTLQVTTALKADVSAVLTRLRELDSRHVKQVASGGAGLEISGDVALFAEIARQTIPRLRSIAANPKSQRSQLLRAWILRLRTMPPDAWSGHRLECDKAVALAKQITAMPLDAAWHERCRHLSDVQLMTLYRHARAALAYERRWWRMLSLRFRRAREAIRKFHDDGDQSAIWELSRQIGNYENAQSVRNQLESLNLRLVPNLRLTPGQDQRAQIQFATCAREEFQWAERMCQQEQEHEWLRNCLDELAATQQPDRLREIVDALDQSLQRLPDAGEAVQALDGLTPYLRADAIAQPEQLIRVGKAISFWLDEVETGLDGLQPLIAWELSHSQHSEPLKSIISALEDYEKQRSVRGHVPTPPPGLQDRDYGQWWLALVRYSASLAWQGECHRQHPLLVTMTPDIHAEKVHELRKLVAEKRNLEADTIRATWLREQIRYRTAPWTRMFQLRRSRNGEAKRLREAVNLSLPEGLLAMRPCWLTNPATAAEVFPLKKGLFDVIIFDEASQCPIEQAIPAIYRGKSVIVSGDEKQLPPTSFFLSSGDDGQVDDDNANEEATDKLVEVEREQQLQRLGVEYLLRVEDLLAAAIGNLPERFLSVHYRSRYPALIEFSNRAFYNGQLEAPPARTSSLNSHRPICYHDLTGLYEHRANKAEARHVVKLLRELWTSDGERPTVGVVTFNQPQRDLIEDLLEEQCSSDNVLQACLQQEATREEDNQDVGFFIKNLENVQGDERDVMIFSTTFGRDGNGQFYRRFGPVGAVGGERRLNVAITRAKHQVHVVSSMPIDEISTALSAGLSPGSQLTPAGYLQLYLAYAKAVSDADSDRTERILDRVGRKLPAMATGDADSPFEEDVRAVLEKLGFTVHGQIGDSGFRIDLGIVARDPTHGYVLGIECDGAAYHTDRSARLRDVWRAQILRGRGWRLHRIWSTRWWYHRGEEIEALKTALDEAESHLDRKRIVTPTTATEPQLAATSGQLDSWRMSLADWKELCEEFRKRGDEDSLRAIGGLGTDFAHRYRVEQALKEGKPVPKFVLDDYPNLLPQNDPTQRDLFSDES